MSERDAYGSIARFYDFFISRPSRGIRQSVAALTPDESPVIDIGCGTGEQSVLLAHKGRHVVGIDSSPAMLAHAEKRRVEGTTFVLGNGGEVPYPDAYFAAAVLSFVLHESGPERRRSLISEAKRLVRQNGSIVIADYEPGKGISAGFLSLGIRLAERLAGTEHYQGYRNWMRQGGLSAFCARHDLRILDKRTHFAGNICVVRCELQQ